MGTVQMMLHEFDSKIHQMENEVQRRKDISNYLNYLKDTGQLTYEDIVCV